MSKKPRKKYRPKYTAHQMLAASTETLYARSAEVIDSDTAVSVFQSLWLALDAMKAGKATPADFNTLSTAGNIATVLCEYEIGAEYLPICAAALNELAHCRARHAKTGVFVLSDEGARAIGEMIEVREAQVTADGYTTGLEYQAAQIVHDRLVRGKVARVEEELA